MTDDKRSLMAALFRSRLEDVAKREERWNELLENAARSTIADYQETLVQAIEELGNANGLNASGNDISWAQYVIEVKKQAGTPAKSIVERLRWETEEEFLLVTEENRLRRMEDLLARTATAVVQLAAGRTDVEEFDEAVKAFVREIEEERG